jgi:hypothetical protein
MKEQGRDIQKKYDLFKGSFVVLSICILIAIIYVILTLPNGINL